MGLLKLNTRSTAAQQAAAAFAAFTEGTAAYPTTFAVPPGTTLVTAGIVYVTLGIGNEVGELAELFDQEAYAPDDRIERYQSAWKELGDVQWYLARLCIEMGGQIGSFDDHVQRAYEDLKSEVRREIRVSGFDLQSGLSTHAGRVLGVVKKAMRDGHAWGEEKRADKMAELGAAVSAMIRLSVDFAERTGPLVGCEGGYVGLLRANTDKLSGRKERGTLHGDGENR